MPVWFRKVGFNPVPGAKLVRIWFRQYGIVSGFLLAYFLYGLSRLRLLTDWPGLIMHEGLYAQAARRIGAGQLPYLDFFFPLPPGILGVQLLMPAGPWAPRIAALAAASLVSALIFRWGQRFGFDFFERFLLATLLFCWGFSLRNVPDPSWYALLSALAAMEAARRGRPGLAGGILAFSSLFSLEGAILSAAGLGLVLGAQGGSKPAARMAAAFSVLLLIPLAGFALWAGLDAAKLVLLTPYWRHVLEVEGDFSLAKAGAPLTAIGLWGLSLYFFRASLKLRALALSAVMLYAAMGFIREGRGFFLGYFFLVSIIAWVASALVATGCDPEKRRDFLFFWAASAGSALAAIPSGDFSRFLIVFPLAALLLVWMLGVIRGRYAWIPRAWLMAPAILLLAGGGALQARMNLFFRYGTEDALGYLSFGDANRLNEEISGVGAYLAAQGVASASPVLAGPNSPGIYWLLGMKNPVPFDQLDPVFIRALNNSLAGVLEDFRAGEGEFVIWQRGAAASPGLEADLGEGFELVKSFPLRFDVWKKRPSR